MDRIKLEPGMKVIIRRNIEDGDFGIRNASQYRGREMTIRICKSSGYKLVEDPDNWLWLFSHFETFYYLENCGDPHVDSSFETMLSGF